MVLQELPKTAISGRKWHTSLFRKNPSLKFPSLELTHNHNTRAQTSKILSFALLTRVLTCLKALVSGGCVISREINFQYSGFQI